MKTAALFLFAAYLLLHGIVFVFHPLKGPFLALSHICLPAGIVDGRPVWYPRVVTFANIALAENPEMRKKEATELGLQEAVYEARVKNLLKELHAPFEKTKGDPVESVLTMSRAANAAVLSSDAHQENVRLRLEGLQERIIDGGMPFADAALRYSEHPSAKINGDLGIMKSEDAPDWMEQVFNTEHVPYSKIIKSPEAYWIFLVKPDDTKGSFVPLARIYGLALQKKELPEVLAKDAKNNRPWVFVW